MTAPTADACDVHSISKALLAGGCQIESLEEPAFDLEESSETILSHPLGLKPAGNQYTANVNSRHHIGPNFSLWPEEFLAIFLEHLSASDLLALGTCCKFFFAFCRSDDLWKTLFIQ
jgi:hypothetical protein